MEECMSTYVRAGRSGVRRRRMLTVACAAGLAGVGALLGATSSDAAAKHKTAKAHHAAKTATAPKTSKAHKAAKVATQAQIGLVTPDLTTPGTVIMRWTGKGTGLQCSVDGASRAACNHPHVFTGLTQAQHTFAIT